MRALATAAALAFAGAGLATAGCASAAGTPDAGTVATWQTRVGDRLGPGGALRVVAISNDFREGCARVDFTIANDGAASLEILDIDVEVGFPPPDDAFSAPYRPYVFQHLQWQDVAPGESRAGSVTLRADVRPALFSRLHHVGGGRVLAAREGGHAGTCFLGWTVECVDLRMDLTAVAPSVAITLENTDADAKPGSPPRRLSWRLRLAARGEAVPLPAAFAEWRPLPEPLGGAPGARCVLTVTGLGDAPGLPGAQPILELREER